MRLVALLSFHCAAAASALTPNIGKAAAVSRPLSNLDALLYVSELRQPDGRVLLTRLDIQTALAEMHIDDKQPWLEGVEHPTTFIPEHLYVSDSAIDVSELVTSSLQQVLTQHPTFDFMASEVVGNDEWYSSVYFGLSERDASSISFPQLCRRLVASVYVFERLLEMDRACHRQLAAWYEARLADARQTGSGQRQLRWQGRSGHSGSKSGASSLRERFVGAWLNLKGESVLASINAFEELRRRPDKASELSDLLNALMAANIFEAIVANLSFAFWPDNARAGLALLLHLTRRPAQYSTSLSQPSLSREWFSLYLTWNANFIWPSHYTADMMCFSMLVAPRIALGAPADFGYQRAHSLFWVVRSNQLSRLQRADADAGPDTERAKELPCFRCRPLEPLSDRQPLTTRTAVRTRASGEHLAASVDEDVSDATIWWRLLLEIAPKQLGSLARLYARMPKSSPTKLRLL
jgi:hypothetical protein